MQKSSEDLAFCAEMGKLELSSSSNALKQAVKEKQTLLDVSKRKRGLLKWRKG